MQEIGREFEIDDSLDSVGGVMMSSIDGRIEVDNTIETRLKKIRYFYASKIIEELFGDLSD